MGSGSSKVEKEVLDEELQKGSVPSTPILSPKVKENNDLDPRSPSTHISRTPLQLLSAAAEKLEDFKQKELYSFGSETPLNSKKIILGIDPRSPTTDFQRTPIVINIGDSNLPKKIHNKNLDKVRKSTIITTPNSTPQKSNIVSPKLLDSSPIKSKPEANKRKSFVGLLETNIDFTETDLDAVMLEKCRIKDKPLDVTPKLRNHADVKIENVDPRSPTTDFLRTPIQIIKKITDSDLNGEESDSVIEVELNLDIKNPDPEDITVEVEDHSEEKSKSIQSISESNTVDVLEDNILPTDEAENVLNNLENVPAINDDLVEIEDNLPVTLETNIINERPIESMASEIRKETKSAPVTPPVTEVKQSSKPIPSISPIHKEIKSAPVTPPLVNLTADVKELDKKLTNLIYQDDMVICPRIVKLKEHSNRSPLKNRNISEPEKKRSTQKLKVSDRPRKSDYAVSKIPVFKEKGKNVEVQCENTPPRNMEKRKVRVKKSHWDNTDATLLI